MFRHTFNTWLVANLLQPLFILLAAGFFNDGIPVSFGDIIIMAGYILIWSLLLSSPCLLIGWGCLFIITHMPSSLLTRFVIWWFTACLLAVLEFLIMAGFGGDVSSEIVIYGFASVMAVFVTVVFRFSQFSKLIYGY